MNPIGWGIPFLWSGRQAKSSVNPNPSEPNGIYLDDLKDADAEMMQVLLPTS